MGHWRAVQDGVCSVCRARVLTGWDSWIGAWRACADPTPLGPTGEVLALLAGRPTYTFAREYSARGMSVVTLTVRDRWDISRPGPAIVVPEHVCGVRIASESVEVGPCGPRSVRAVVSDLPPF